MRGRLTQHYVIRRLQLLTNTLTLSVEVVDSLQFRDNLGGGQFMSLSVKQEPSMDSVIYRGSVIPQ